MSGVGPITQDWEPVVIRKKAPNAAAKKDQKVVNAARRSGADIEIIKKYTRVTEFSQYEKHIESNDSFNEKPQIIQEYESGKAIPNQQIIGKLERALGAKLRGKMKTDFGHSWEL
ncbi:hypothetical protein GH714_010601 [Hevea brasiliensis]|uniref:Multiprotein bridging factor 1 N-terminal domain-containing protein n=1 Tax=Hevea brasiliensis TaxID=3981 RepID=A0A6A6KB74_HEVBR|nr:hypothetical protein GH714_010601 [Hevea brasiliensis]